MKISNIFKEVINEDFKSQTANFIKQGFDANIVKTYVDKFKYIRDNKFKEMFDEKLDISVPPQNRNDIDAYKDFHDLERLVDYVGGRRQGVSTLGKKEDIELDAKPVYEDDNFVVYYADTPRACIKYKGNFPYSWCVARSDASNMFYTYRFKPYEPAFYFVKNKKLTEKEFGVWNMTKNVFKGEFKYPYHFFVIQVPKNINIESDENEQYIVTSANNDGDKQMSWKDILKLSPNIAQIKEVLKPKPFTDEEREKNNRFKNGISDEEFARLSYEDKRSYLDIYPTISRPITTKQLIELPDDLLNLYVSFGIGLNDEQFAHIKPKKDVLKRYTQISKRKLEEYLKSSTYDRRRLRMAYTELIVLSDEEIKSYLETLDKKELNRFIKDNGEDKIEVLEKHVSDKFTTEFKDLKAIVLKAKDDDEEALNKLSSMVPENIDISFSNSGNFIIIDTSNYGSILQQRMDNNVYELLERVEEDRQWGGSYYDDYFDGDSQGLNDTYENYILDFIKNNQDLKQEFDSFGLEFNFETVDDLLETYKEKDDIRETISNEYTYAKEKSEQKAWDKIKDEIKSIVYLYDDSVYMKVGPFIMNLLSYKLFTTDAEQFIDNLGDFIDFMLNDNDLPDNMDTVWEEVNEAGWSFMDIDDDKIYRTIKSGVSDAIYEFSKDEGGQDDTEEQPNTVKLKSEIITLLKNTLKGLGQSPDASTIENDIARIDIDRQKFKLDGKVYIKIYDKQHKKEHEGYVFINDLPAYFKNYKLFEQISRIKKLIKY